MLILSGLQGGEGREGEESRACNEGYRKVYLIGALSAIVESLRTFGTPSLQATLRRVTLWQLDKSQATLAVSEGSSIWPQVHDEN